jgi:predicted Rossmann-fold nucleotide-binding protein
MKRYSLRGEGGPFEHVTDSDSLPEDGRAPVGIEQLVQQLKETADKLIRDQANRGDVKLLSTALKELRYAFKVFAPYRQRRKVTVFGSARLSAEHPAYAQAVEFSRRMVESRFMVITGAASGIMEAGHVGAGRENSIGVNILLPFEQDANAVIAGDAKLMHLKYFFTRKNKAMSGGDYWTQWKRYIEEVLLKRGMISPPDMALFKVTDSVDDAVAEVVNFYRVYHSMRYVDGYLVLRLQRPLPDPLVEKIRSEFADIVDAGTFELTAALPAEANETHLAALPRLCFRFDRKNLGRLRMLVDTINREG